MWTTAPALPLSFSFVSICFLLSHIYVSLSKLVCKTDVSQRHAYLQAQVKAAEGVWGVPRA